VASAAYLLSTTIVSSDSSLLSPGLAAIVVLVAGLLLAVNHAYLILRSVAYSSGRRDAGRSWISHRRELVRGSLFSGNRRTIIKRIAFLAVSFLLAPATIVATSIAALLLMVGLLVAGLVDSVPGETAGLIVGLVPFAVLVAVLVVARAALAAVIFPERDGPAKPLVAYGSLPDKCASVSSLRSMGVGSVLSHLSNPVPALVLLVSAAVPVLVALDLRGVELGVVVGLLLLHLAFTNWIFFTASREWWRQLQQKRADLRLGRSAKTPTSFPRGTMPPTQRILVDLVTPLGPNAEIAQLGGLLADHRAFDVAPVRWTIVTEPDRVDAVTDFLRRLFELHACRAAGTRVRVLGATETGAGPKRNHAARQATAPFVTFIDSDDRLDLLRLMAAVSCALVRDRALQSVHLFPYQYQNPDGMLLRTPGEVHQASITHHHCARLWPSGLFRSGLASYGDVDYEDAIFAIDMGETVDHCVHKDPQTAFLTYDDHRDAPGRLTRSYKDSGLLVRRLAEEALADSKRPAVANPSEREKALIGTLVGRIAADLAWGHGSTLDILRSGLGEFAPYAKARGDEAEISAEMITRNVEGVRRRSDRVRSSANDRGLMSFLRDELSAKVPRTTTLAALNSDGSSEQFSDERRLGLLIGLMNTDPLKARPSDAAPTVFYNLAGEEYATARRAVSFYARQPHFCVESDPQIPLGDVEVFDPVDRSRQRLGSFADDRLMSSRLLRLWERFYPSLSEVEQARAHVVLQGLAVNSSESTVRLVATGPSSGASTQDKSVGPDVLTVCCNSWVRQPGRMAEIGAKILTAADPIFHAGPSEYAHQFRSGLTDWLRSDPEHLFVTVSRDIGIYLAELPVDVHDQVIAPAFEAAIDLDNPLPLETGRVQPFPNIMTLLMLPLAEHLQPTELGLYGFDGGAKGAEEYWQYDPSLNYSDELQQSVRDWHPEFFRVDYQQYRDEHDEHVAMWLKRIEEQGIRVGASAPSNVPAVDAAFRANPVLASNGADL
jgi:hypothetical protein